jgi:hypothetical protein
MMAAFGPSDTITPMFERLDDTSNTGVPSSFDNRPRPPTMNRKETRKAKATKRMQNPRRR